MTDTEREQFDELLTEAIESLPERIRAVIDEVPVIVDDRPTQKLLNELRAEGVLPPADPNDADDLMGLHTGLAITERSVEASGTLPGSIHVFREGIVHLACGSEGFAAEDAEDLIYEEIAVTLLHEIGHHFGLDEDDLDRLGYS